MVIVRILLYSMCNFIFIVYSVQISLILFFFLFLIIAKVRVMISSQCFNETCSDV